MSQLIDDLKDVRLAIFDLDGIVYRGNNEIPGVANIIKRLKARSIRVVFNSNNSTLTRKMYVEKLRKFQIASTIDDIFTSAYITAEEISKIKLNAQIYIIGEKGLKEELKAKNHQICEDVIEPNTIDFVIVGLDRNFNYKKLAIAQNCISQGHAQFYATNTDATLPENDIELPGAGCMVAALERCVSQKPISVFGKPSPLGIKMILEKTKIQPYNTVIFGDRLDTDIMAGNQARIKTVLVLTGVTTKENINELKEKKDIMENNLFPNIIINSLEEIFV